MFSLKEMFDKEVIVTLAEAWAAKWPGGRYASDQPHYYEIVGKRGRIYPEDETTVCLQVPKATGKRLLKLFGPKCVFKRRSDDEFELIIPLELIRSCFRYIKPRFRRSERPNLTGVSPLNTGGFKEKNDYYSQDSINPLQS